MGTPDELLLLHAGTHINETTFNQAFGRILSKFRGSDDFNPTRTNQYAGLDRSFLYAVERGEKGVSLFTLFRIASASKLTPSEIVRHLELALEEISEGKE